MCLRTPAVSNTIMGLRADTMEIYMLDGYVQINTFNAIHELYQHERKMLLSDKHIRYKSIASIIFTETKVYAYNGVKDIVIPYYLFALSNNCNNIIYVGDCVDLDEVDFDNAYLETVDGVIDEFKASKKWADKDIDFFFYINKKESVLRIISSNGRFKDCSMIIIPLDPNAIDW